MHRTTQRKDQGLESRRSPRGWSPVPALLSLFGATSVRFSLSEAQSLTTQRSPGHGMVSDIQQAGREQREEGTGGERSVQRA